MMTTTTPAATTQAVWERIRIGVLRKACVICRDRWFIELLVSYTLQRRVSEAVSGLMTLHAKCNNNTHNM